METRVFRTNLKCNNCVSKVAVFLSADRDIADWSVDTNDERKLLSVTGPRLDSAHIRSLVNNAGFEVFDEIPPDAAEAEPPASTTYFPLLLIFMYLTGFVVLSQLRAGRWEWMTMMSNFMGGFFIVFSFFKLLNLRAFADAYASYDIIARRAPAYGLIYPFIELTLGICYVLAFAPFATNLANFVVMSVGSLGIVRSLLAKNKIQCACLGTVFNLPMSKVTLIEDLLMLGMAATMIGAML